MPYEFEEVSPSAAALTESLRGIGYSMPAAIADLIDNSISAEAKSVWLRFDWRSGEPTISVLDDGHGMDATELVDAMRLGSRSPLERRQPTDLGRFGLGLKTAAFSQCRCLTVATCRLAGKTEIRRWDLDHLSRAPTSWHLLKGPGPGSEQLISPLADLPHGTLVLLEKLDRLGEGVSDETLSERAFLEAIDLVEQHLAMVFHRFLEGPSPRLRIFINGRDEPQQVKPWDPFLLDHPATIRRPVERIATASGMVEVQGFVLPHKDWLAGEKSDRGAGPGGWTAQQGFYVYRNRRMIVAGSWLGLGSPRRWTKEEAHKLARLRIDIGNGADQEWKIDIRKSIARVPYQLRPRLRALGEDARQLARQVFVHRGSYGARPPEPDVSRVWMASQNKSGVVYRIDRRHPAVRQVLEFDGKDGTVAESMLRVIEETVPVQRIWLDTTEKGEPAETCFSGSEVSDVQAVLAVIYRSLRTRTGLDAASARSRLMFTEPFNCFPSLVAALPDEPDPPSGVGK